MKPMSLMSQLSRHVFHPLWDLKDGSHTAA